MKQLKDYLHLYLGCECYYDRTHYAGKLIGIEDDSAFTWDTVNGRIVWNLKKLLPILRPLSSMTEEETEEYRTHKMQLYQWDKDNGMSAIINHYGNSVAFLLSKYFDLFNLIESGLAIDATTLKKS